MSTPTARLPPQSLRTLQELVAGAERNGLVLFVGSGISAELVPVWKSLLGGLLDIALKEAAFQDNSIHGWPEAVAGWMQSHFDVCAKASLIKQILGPERYRAEVRHALYKKCFDIQRRMETDFAKRAGKEKGEVCFDAIWHVASLCSRPAVRAVATFNFDTLLETAILCLGERTPRPHCGEAGARFPGSSGERDLPIFHVHGRLLPPSSLVRDPRASLVFSYDEYFDKNAEPLSWETATPLHLLRNYCSLWLGASMTDWNMLRLLYGANGDAERPQVFCLQSLAEAEKAKPYAPAAMRFQATLLKSVGVKLIVAGADYAYMWRVLAEQVTQALPPYCEK
jgi:hypothetical protein